MNSEATADEIKSAFRRLAKEFHPDVNPSPAAKARFQAISEAYAVLGNEDLRARYDAQAATERRAETRSETKNRTLDPICCSVCGNITAQPRPIVFYRVFSFIFSAVRKPVSGVFCSGCARKTALKSSLITAIAGWWSLPGLLWTIGTVIINAKGGRYSRQEEERLLWYNAVAFASQGTLALAHGLTQRLRKADDNEISVRAFRLMQHLQAMGVPANTPPLKNAWNFRIAPALAQIAMLIALPALAAGYFFFDKPASPPSAASNFARPFPAGDLGQFLSRNSASNKPVTASPKVAAPQCAVPPNTGQVLERRMVRQETGHRLEISNGTSGDAIIKIRDANTGALKLSFFVSRGNSARIDGLPDGYYRFQYALGNALDASCKSFLDATASQFPNAEQLTTRRTATQIVRSRLSYTLYSVRHGNVRPQPLSLSAFNAD